MIDRLIILMVKTFFVLFMNVFFFLRNILKLKNILCFSVTSTNDVTIIFVTQRNLIGSRNIRDILLA